MTRLALFELSIALAVLAAGCTSPQTTADDWAAIRAQDIASLAPGWGPPVPLGVNRLDGWIDSLHVSADGKTVYYVFYPGPDLITDTTTGDLKGDADIYLSEEPFETHRPVGKFFMNEQPWSACCVQLDGEGNFWYNSNREARKGGSAEGLFDWHPLFRNDQLLPLNERGKEFGDVFYCAARDELWGVEGQELYILKSAKANGFSGKPEKAPAPMRQGGQPYLTPDCNTLYYTANYGDVPSQGPAIYKSARTGDGWSAPAAVAWSKTGVGEFTLTADGSKAFFAQLFKNAKGEFRIGAFYAERKGGVA